MIKSFQKDYSFLGNFHPCIIDEGDFIYPSVEAALTARQTENETIKKILTTASTGKFCIDVKKNNPTEFFPINVEVELLGLLKEKFSNEELAEKLKATGDEYLLNSVYWHDNVLGFCPCAKCKDVDANNLLGELLMRVREELTDTSDEV